jgi:hypothetical protein
VSLAGRGSPSTPSSRLGSILLAARPLHTWRLPGGVLARLYASNKQRQSLVRADWTHLPPPNVGNAEFTAQPSVSHPCVPVGPHLLISRRRVLLLNHTRAGEFPSGILGPPFLLPFLSAALAQLRPRSTPKNSAAVPLWAPRLCGYLAPGKVSRNSTEVGRKVSETKCSASFPTASANPRSKVTMLATPDPASLSRAG